MGTLYKKIILLTLLFFSTTLFASVAKVVAFKGEATITREGTTISLDKKSSILKHDEIKTKENTKIQLLFKDETIVSIGKNSTFKVLDYLYDEKNNNHKAELNMIEGTFRTITGKIGKFAPKRFNLKTKSASIGIRGTQIVMSISPNEEKIFCTEGKIFVQKLNSKISSTVNAGEFVSFKPGETKQKIDVKKIKKGDLKNINKNVRIQKNLAVDTISVKSDIEDGNDNTKKQTENTPSTNSATLSNAQNNEKTQNIDSEIKETTKVVKKEIEEEKKNQEKENTAAKKATEEEAKKLAEERKAKIEADKIAAEKKAKIEADKIAAEEATKLAEEQKAKAEAERLAAKEAERLAAEKKAKIEESKIKAEEAVKLAEEQKAKAEAERLAAKEAERLAEEAKAKAEAEKLAAEEKIKNAITEEEKAQAKAEKLAAEEAERLAEEAKAKAEAERLAAEEAERLAEEAKAKAEAERLAAEEAKRLAEEQKAKAEAERLAAEEAKRLAEEQKAKAEAERLAAEEAERLAKEELLKANTINLFKLTSEDFLKNDNSKVKYNGSFNNYSYNSENQYLKKHLVPIQIPTNTTISMDIDFGANKDHISNGKVIVSDTYNGYYDTTLEFDGKIKDPKKAEFELKGTNNTTGSGSGKFYGEEANAIKGEIDLEDNNSIGIKGNFDANKEGFDDEFFTIDDITPKSYFEDFDSVATYKGDFNNYSYDDKDQYMQYTSGNKEAIPTNTKISMDVNFGAVSDHISNGKIEASGTSEVLTFDGHYHDNDAKFHIDPTGNTEGSRGEGYFYGSEADIMSGKVDFNSKTSDLAIKGTFDAKKQ